MAELALSNVDCGRDGLAELVKLVAEKAIEMSVWPSRHWPSGIVADLVLAEMVCGRHGCDSLNLRKHA